MATPDPNAMSAFGEEVRPYKIHVSSRYLELTHQKLDLTRLPHENSDPKSKEWWEPKALVEPLIDYWLEQYAWREEMSKLNNSVSQFRTSFLIPGSETSTRLHFIHTRSPHSNAVPLLLIPPFPFSNLSLSHLITSFTDPEDAGANQPFHLVIPSLPGLGFSDALPNNTPMIATTAELLDLLMKRLNYPQYIATNSGSAASSPARIDWQLANNLSIHFSESCLGVHFISPALQPPTLKDAPSQWMKWRIAKALKKPVWGYSNDDFSSLERNSGSAKDPSVKPAEQLSHSQLAFTEPNTLAYALCDSPTGLLLFLMMILRVMGSTQKFSQSEMITLVGWKWLPGPEGMLRYWAHCANTKEESRSSTRKPRVSITVFSSGKPRAADDDEQWDVPPQTAASSYACPAWANTHYEVVSVTRVSGEPGLLAWERPQVIIDGARKLAKAILAVDKRMQASEQPGQALLDQVVIGGGLQAPADISGSTVQASSTASPKKALSPVGVHGPEFLEIPDTNSRPVTARRDPPAQAPVTPEEEEEDQESSPDTVIGPPNDQTLQIPVVHT